MKVETVVREFIKKHQEEINNSKTQEELEDLLEKYDNELLWEEEWECLCELLYKLSGTKDFHINISDKSDYAEVRICPYSKRGLARGGSEVMKERAEQILGLPDGRLPGNLESFFRESILEYAKSDTFLSSPEFEDIINNADMNIHLGGEEGVFTASGFHLESEKPTIISGRVRWTPEEVECINSYTDRKGKIEIPQDFGRFSCWLANGGRWGHGYSIGTHEKRGEDAALTLKLAIELFGCRG